MIEFFTSYVIIYFISGAILIKIDEPCYL